MPSPPLCLSQSDPDEDGPTIFLFFEVVPSATTFLPFLSLVWENAKLVGVSSDDPSEQDPEEEDEADEEDDDEEELDGVMLLFSSLTDRKC